MTQYRYTLEPYKSMSTRHQCPVCLKNNMFTLYVDTETGDPLAEHVGRCSRKIKCGYHFTPKQFFAENKNYVSPVKGKRAVVIRKEKPTSYLSNSILNNSLGGYHANNFVHYLKRILGVNITSELLDRYFIGSSNYWKGATVFWQVDSLGKIRTGKIMLYNKETGKREKDPFSHIIWAHTLGKTEDFELNQCLFGEHLLKMDLEKPIAIVESEKTATITSGYLPQFLWMATGGLSNLSIKTMKILEGRNVTLFPDLGCYKKWSDKAKEFSDIVNVTVSDLLELNATEQEKHFGLDLADYLIRFNAKDFLKSGNGVEAIFSKQNPVSKAAYLNNTKPILEKDNDHILRPASRYIIYKNEPKTWSEKIKELEMFFETNSIPTTPLKISDYMIISDIKAFIKSHFLIIKANNGNSAYLPYLNRLEEVKNFITQVLDQDNIPPLIQ